MMQTIGEKKMLNKKNVQGVTAAGWLIIIMVILFFVYLVIKMVPAYLEFSDVKTVMQNTKQAGVTNLSKNEISKRFKDKLGFARIKFLTKDNYKVIENKKGKFLDVQYDKKISMFGNVSILIEYEHSLPLQ